MSTQVSGHIYRGEFYWRGRVGSGDIFSLREIIYKCCRSQWPPRRRSAAVRQLRLWVQIQTELWMSVFCEYCVLSPRCLYNELITHPEESYRMWCIVVCDLETSKLRRPWPTGGLLRHRGEKIFKCLQQTFQLQWSKVQWRSKHNKIYWLGYSCGVNKTTCFGLLWGHHQVYNVSYRRLLIVRG